MSLFPAVIDKPGEGSRPAKGQRGKPGASGSGSGGGGGVPPPSSGGAIGGAAAAGGS